MTNDQNTALLEILPEIERAAKSVASEWATVVEREDLEQEIIVRLLRDNYAGTVRDMDPPARKRVLFKIGSQLAAQEAVDLEHFSGNFTYSTNEVRALLNKGALNTPGHDVLDGDFVEYGEDGESPVSVAACEISVEGIDLRTAFVRLTEEQRAVLVDRFVHDLVSEDTAVRKATQRAVDALTQEMNRARRRAHESYRSR